MKIVTVEDEKLVLEGMLDTIRAAVPGAKLYGFRDPEEADEKIEDIRPDVVFLDVELRTMSGVELAEKIRRRLGDVNIIFTTGYTEYMADAFRLHASGYLLKPITVEKVREEMQNLRVPVPAENTHKKIRVQAFGDFEIFADDEPVRFCYSLTKELTAYLIDRSGALCSQGQLMSILWPDDDAQVSHLSYFRNLRNDLVTTLRACGAEDILELRRGMLGIRRDKVDCDYFDWLDDKPGAKDRYHGEYMSQYSWGELVHAAIESSLF